MIKARALTRPINSGLLLVLLVWGCRGGLPEGPGQPMTNGGGGELMPVEELEGLLRKAKADGSSTIPCSGRSVFEGTRIETFHAEIVDVIRNFIGPNRHLILARLKPSHPVVAKAGVIAGMSGSPMYVGGRMIGALAYGWTWAKEPLIGITPILDMIEDGNRTGPEVARSFEGSEAAGLAPIRTPLYVSGLSSRGLELLQKEIEPYPIAVVPSGRGSAVHPKPGAFEPGSAIGVTLAAGDVDMSGIGTVTYVDGDKVLAFGHPMFGEGPVDLPVTTAVVHAVFAGMARSFKIASSVDEVGALVQDRSACIAGILGRSARLIPVQVELHDPAENLTHTVNVRLIDNARWFPMLLNMVSFMAEDTYHPSGRPRTIVSDYRITLDTGERLDFAQVRVVNPDGGTGWASAGPDLLDKLMQIMRNPYRKAGFQSVSVRHEYVPEVRSGTIKEAWALTPEVPARGSARVRLALEHWRAPESHVDVEIPLPPELRPGDRVEIEVAGADWATRVLPPYGSFEEMIEVLRKEFEPTHVVATVQLPKPTLHYRGRTIERLPGSALLQIIPGTSDPGVVSSTPARARVDAGRVVTGSATVTVRVR